MLYAFARISGINRKLGEEFTITNPDSIRESHMPPSSAFACVSADFLYGAFCLPDSIRQSHMTLSRLQSHASHVCIGVCLRSLSQA